MKNVEKKKIPFSKKNIIYARLEAYAFSLILIGMVWLEKDVSAIAILLSLAWGGYKGLQCFYLKSAEREHLEEIRQGRLRENLFTDDIDEKINALEYVSIEDKVNEVLY